MATTGTETVRDLVTDALLDVGAATLGQAPAADEMELGVRHLSRLMKQWQTEGYPLFVKTTQSVTPVADTLSYTMSPVRPIRVLNANFKDTSGIETPMFEMSRDEYDALPDKDSNGVPTNFHYDRQRESALLYIWPVPSSVTTETIEVTYEREIEDLTTDDTIDCPGEWYNAMVLGLAYRLCYPFQKFDQMAILRADSEDALNTAFASDTEDSVFFNEGPYG